MKQVIVVGGGAGGMMAAYSAAIHGASVTLLEQNEKLGKKIYITGKGRCNLCNASDDPEVFFQNVRMNQKFMYSAFYQWDNKAVMELFEKAGCPLKTERGDRVFPVSDHSSDVIGALKRLLGRENVKVMLGSRVKEILFDGNDERSFQGIRLDTGELIKGDACIIATGGLSYPSTGSTGDGYRFASEAGHEIVTMSPGLVPLETKEDWPKEVMGLSLKNVSLKMIRGKKTLYDGFGEMMFTHFGVTGPLVLSASGFYDDKKKEEETKLIIDLKPALDQQQLDKRLIREFEANRSKLFKNSLGSLFPSKLIPVMVRLSGIDPEKKCAEIGKQERQRFAELIKALPLKVKGTRDFDEAIITKGGVGIKKINPSTMESRLVHGLFFAGEVMDLDAMTGGFNLQIAWSTGYLAGKSAASTTEDDFNGCKNEQ